MGFITCDAATLLAREVLSSMLLNRLKGVSVLVFVGVVSGLGLWQGLGAASQDRAQTPARAAASKKSMPQPVNTPKPKAPAPGTPYRLRGVVRVEGSGELIE